MNDFYFHLCRLFMKYWSCGGSTILLRHSNLSSVVSKYYSTTTRNTKFLHIWRAQLKATLLLAINDVSP